MVRQHNKTNTTLLTCITC